MLSPSVQFTLCFLLIMSTDEKRCAQVVGGPIKAKLPGNSTRADHLILKATFPCNGTVKAWVYYKTNTDASVYLSVWRNPQLGPEAGNYFQLIGKNRIPLGSMGKRIFRVKPKYRIQVQAGDFIGYHYSMHHEAGAIAVLKDTHVTDRNKHNYLKPKHPFFHDTLTAGLYDENFLLQTPINFNTNDMQIIKQRNSLAVLVEYHTESKFPLVNFS